MAERWIPSSHGFQVVTEDSMHSIALVKETGDPDSQFNRAALLAAAPELFEAAKQAMVYFLMQDDESVDDMTLSLQRHHAMQLIFPALRNARGITTVVGDTGGD